MSSSNQTGRKSPTAAQLRAWRSFIETSERVTGVIATRMQEQSGMSTGDYTVLLALSEAPGTRMRSSALADHIGWERSRLSHHLGRMEKRGSVRRESAAADSRGAEVCLTESGARSFRAASAPHLHTVHDVFVQALTDEQIAAVEGAMRAIEAHLDARDGRPI